MKRRIVFRLLAFVCVSLAGSRARGLSISADSPRWDLQGEAKVVDYLGRKSILLDGGAAILKDFEMRDAVIDVDVATPAAAGILRRPVPAGRHGANGEWVYLRQHKSGLPRRDAVHAGAQHRRELADLQRAGLHRRGRDPEGRVVPPAPGGDRRAGEALRQGHGDAGARDDRLEERRPEGRGGAARSDRRDLLLEFRDPDDAGRAVGAAPAGDAAPHADEVEPLAFLRCARPRSRAPAVAVRARRDALAGRRGGTARLRRPLSLPRGPAPQGVVRERLLETPGAADRERGSSTPGRRSNPTGSRSRSSRSATATRSACS